MNYSFFPQRPASRPMIYAYEDTNPQYKGLLKVGYTTVDVDKRVAQQYPTKRPDGSVPYRIVLRESAMYPDGGSFTDKDVHKMLRRKQITGMGGEWFKCTVDDVRAAIIPLTMKTERRYSVCARSRRMPSIGQSPITALPMKKALRGHRNFCGTPRCASAKPLLPMSWQRKWSSPVS